METAADIAQRVFDLWFHRKDCFTTQYFNPRTKMGGYLKVCKVHPTWARERCQHKTEGVKCGKCEKFQAMPVTTRIVKAHLDGALTCGAYQLGEDGYTAKWGCLDFDDHGLCSVDELQDAARVAQMSLESLGLPSYFEASGGNGWRCHLWTFFAEPVPAIKLRVVYQAALEQAGLEGKPYIERFPKQARALNGYGNLVKVPFGVHQKTKKRSQFLDANLEPIGLEDGLRRIKTVDPAALDFIIDMKNLKLEETPFAHAAPVKNFDHPAELMDRTLTHCWYFRELERQQLSPDYSVHYEDWWNLVLYCSRFGDTGVQHILDTSHKDSRFDFEYTVNVVNYIREHGYHAPGCKRLREGPGLIHCSLDPLHCGAPNAGNMSFASNYESRPQLRPARIVVQI